MFEGVRAESQTFLTTKMSSSTMLTHTLNYRFILMGRLPGMAGKRQKIGTEYIDRRLWVGKSKSPY